MRTNIEIDDKLMKEAMRSANTKTKKETVEADFRMLVRLKRQEGIRGLRGKVKWEGNLDALRQGRAIIVRMSSLSPDNAVWKRDLAWFDEQIAEVAR